jgi:PAS domain S-box-containing protein
MQTATADRYLEILNGVNANIWEADPKTLQRSFVSRYAQTLLGFPLDEWLKPGFWESRLHPEDKDRAVSEAKRKPLVEDAFNMTYRLIAKNDRVFHVRDVVAVVRGEGGKPQLIRGVMTDETALYAATEALRNSEQRLRIMLESAKDYAIFTMDLSGEITSWNAGAENVLGYPAHEIIGTNASIIFTPEDREHGDDVDERKRALQVGRSVNERWHLHKSGRRLWGSGLMMPLRDEKGRDIGVMKIMRDMTEQMRLAEKAKTLNAELELRVSERTAQLESANRELESFSYSVSHDLHAPLRAIDGFSRMLVERDGKLLDEAGRDYLDKIRGASQRMSRLIDDLLDLAHVVRGPMHTEECDLGALARETAKELAPLYPGRVVALTVMPDLAVRADRLLLGIMLFNLMDNAWKFSSKTSSPAVEVGRLAGAHPVFFVRDNGAGFDMAHGSKLFQEFSRLHDPSDFPGTGIGLATVQRIVRRHGGRIWAEGKPGVGSTFYFTLSSEP